MLREAGISRARGSDDDISNLSIAVMAKKLNPDIFVVARQNQAANDVLCESFRAAFGMVHTCIVAQECISILTTPLLARFLDAVRQADESVSKQFSSRLESICEALVPEVWDVGIDERVGLTVREALLNHQSINVGQLLRDNADRAAAFPANQNKGGGRLWKFLFRNQ